MLNDVTRHKFQDMSQLVRLEGKHTAQTAHCALLPLSSTWCQLHPHNCPHLTNVALQCVSWLRKLAPREAPHSMCARLGRDLLFQAQVSTFFFLLVPSGFYNSSKLGGAQLFLGLLYTYGLNPKMCSHQIRICHDLPGSKYVWRTKLNL